MDSYTRDVGYLTSDLLTGKSLPVLTAIALLPLDPSLLGTMVLLGVFGGTVVTLTHAWAPPPPGSLAWGARFVNLFFAAFLDVSFCMHVAARSGASAYWAIPAFAVGMQALPERPSTPVVLGTLTVALFYLSVFETATHTVRHPSVSISRRLLAVYDPLPLPEPGLHEDAHRVLDSLGASLLVLALTFYASVCHGPLVGQRYTSPAFARGRWYTVAVCTAAGLTRAYTYVATAFFQDHALHVLLDGSGRPPEPWTAWLYQATLMYSAAWACSQLTEQVLLVHVCSLRAVDTLIGKLVWLSVFVCRGVKRMCYPTGVTRVWQVLTALPADRTDLRARTLALVFILAYWHAWAARPMFWATIAVAVGTLAALGAASVVEGFRRPTAPE